MRDKRSRWALPWWIRLLPNVAPRIMSPLGRTFAVRIYPDECTTDGRLAAVAFVTSPEDKSTVMLHGADENALQKRLKEAKEISGLEMFFSR